MVLAAKRGPARPGRRGCENWEKFGQPVGAPSIKCVCSFVAWMRGAASDPTPLHRNRITQGFEQIFGATNQSDMFQCSPLSSRNMHAVVTVVITATLTI